LKPVITLPDAEDRHVVVIASQAADLMHPPNTALDMVGALERCGLSRFGAAVRTGGLP